MTPNQDDTIRRMCAESANYHAIAAALGLARTTVTERARKLGCSPAKQAALPEGRNVRGKEPLPAGHSATWRAISNEPFPQAADVWSAR